MDQSRLGASGGGGNSNVLKLLYFPLKLDSKPFIVIVDLISGILSTRLLFVYEKALNIDLGSFFSRNWFQWSRLAFFIAWKYLFRAIK